MNDTTKRQSVIEATITMSPSGWAERLTIQFLNGQQFSLCGVGDADLDQLICRMAMLHGLKQKLVDAAAIARNPETGRAATVEDKYQAVKTVYDRLLAGQWNATREGGGNAGGLLFQALCRMYAGRKTPDELKAFLAEKTDAEKTALRKNPRVAQIIDDIRDEQGKAANIDTDELLGELDEEQ